jgi:hypothetical protein
MHTTGAAVSAPAAAADSPYAARTSSTIGGTDAMTGRMLSDTSTTATTQLTADRFVKRIA